MNWAVLSVLLVAVVLAIKAPVLGAVMALLAAALLYAGKKP